MRNEKGQFVKGNISWTKGKHPIPWNKGRKGRQKNHNTDGLKLGRLGKGMLGKHYKHTEEYKKRMSLLMKGKHLGHIAWNKGIHKATNTGRTQFKKGLVPHNYKGGISKTKEYRRYYHSRYKFRKRNCLGDHAFGEWEIMKAQYDWTCPACHRKEPIIKLTEDHIIPLSKGGSNNIENIQPLCISCNSHKHNKIIPKYAFN